eukprot:2630136-Lingulodinium_polyedra.AAC.1
MARVDVAYAVSRHFAKAALADLMDGIDSVCKTKFGGEPKATVQARVAELRVELASAPRRFAELSRAAASSSG